MRVVIGVALLGVAGFVVWRAFQTSEPAAPAAAPPDPRSSRVQGAPGFAAATAPLAALGPLGVGAAVAGGFADAYYGNPAAREGAKAAGRDIQQFFADNTLWGKNGLGLVSSPRDKRRSRRDMAGLIALDFAGELEGVQDHALKVYNAASRYDVDRWWIDQDANFNVLYKGQSDPFKIETPKTADYPAAWVFEAIVRTTGRAAQAGVGPLQGEFYTTATPGFDPNNPYAPGDYTWGGSKADELEYQRTRAARR